MFFFYGGNRDSATPLQPSSFSFWKPSPVQTAAVLTFPFFWPIFYDFFFTEEWRSYIFDEFMQGVFAKPSLGISSSVPWKAWSLGNDKEFRATEEAYFQNIGMRVNPAQIGNVPTGPARLNIVALLNGFHAGRKV